MYCKFHGWQQCPACSSEIAVLQAALTPEDNCPPRKRMRVSYDDDGDDDDDDDDDILVMMMSSLSTKSWPLSLT